MSPPGKSLAPRQDSTSSTIPIQRLFTERDDPSGVFSSLDVGRFPFNLHPLNVSSFSQPSRHSSHVPRHPPCPLLPRLPEQLRFNNDYDRWCHHKRSPESSRAGSLGSSSIGRLLAKAFGVAKCCHSARLPIAKSLNRPFAQCFHFAAPHSRLFSAVVREIACAPAPEAPSRNKPSQTTRSFLSAKSEPTPAPRSPRSLGCTSLLARRPLPIFPARSIAMAHAIARHEDSAARFRRKWR